MAWNSLTYERDTSLSTSRQRVPAWVLSLFLHGILFALFLFTFRVVQKAGLPDSGRAVGVALVKQNDLRREYVLSDQQPRESQTES
ncbi:MAG: hypothetical protein KDE20_20575, partial [Caldilineaceae bacterium]|nr:hypothetical protein [Caldilineaceae bacterium]